MTKNEKPPLKPQVAETNQNEASGFYEKSPEGISVGDVASQVLEGDSDYNNAYQEHLENRGIDPQKVSGDYFLNNQQEINQGAWEKFVELYPKKAEALAIQYGLKSEEEKIQDSLGKHERLTKKMKLSQEREKDISELRELESQMNKDVSEIEATFDQAKPDLSEDASQEIIKDIGLVKKEKVGFLKKMMDVFKRKEVDGGISTEVVSDSVQETQPLETVTDTELEELIGDEKEPETMIKKEKKEDQMLSLSKDEYEYMLKHEWENGLAIAKKEMEKNSGELIIPDDYLEKQFEKAKDLVGFNDIAEDKIELPDKVYNSNLHRIQNFAEEMAMQFDPESLEKPEKMAEVTKEQYSEMLKREWENGVNIAHQRLIRENAGKAIPSEYMNKQYEKMLNFIGFNNFDDGPISITEDAFNTNLQRVQTRAENAIMGYEASDENQAEIEEGTEPNIFEKADIGEVAEQAKDAYSSEKGGSELKFAEEPELEPEVVVNSTSENKSELKLEKEPGAVSEQVLEAEMSSATNINELMNVLNSHESFTDSEGVALHTDNIVFILREIRTKQRPIEDLPNVAGIRDTFQRICDANDIEYVTTAEIVERWKKGDLDGGKTVESVETQAVENQEPDETENQMAEAIESGVEGNNEKVAEKSMENIELSAATLENALKEIVKKDPDILRRLKLSLEKPEDVVEGSDLISQTLKEALENYFQGLGLKPEQLEIVKAKMDGFVGEIESSVKEKLQNTIDYQAMDKVGGLKKMFSKFSKKSLKDIGITVGVVSAISIAGSALGLGAMVVGGVAGVAKGAMWVYKKRKGEKMTAEEKQAERDEIEGKNQKLMSAERGQILEQNNFDDSRGNDKNKFVMNSENLASLIANTVKMESLRGFHEGALFNENGEMDHKVKIALHESISDHVENNPKYLGFTPEEKQMEINKLYALYARQMINENDLTEMTDKVLKSESEDKLMKVVERMQGIMGGDIADYKKSKSENVGLLMVGAAFMGASMRTAFRSGAGAYLSSALGALSGASFGAAMARSKEMSRYINNFNNEVNGMMTESQSDLDELQTILTSGKSAHEKKIALTNFENKIGRLEGMTNMTIPGEGGNQSLFKDEVLKTEVQAFTMKAREFLFNNSKEDEFAIPTKVAEQMDSEQIEARKRNNLDRVINDIEDKMYRSQNELAQEMAAKFKDQQENNKYRRIGYALIGAVAGGIISKYTYEAISGVKGIFGDKAPEELGETVAPDLNIELNSQSGAKVESLQHAIFNKEGTELGYDDGRLEPGGGGEGHIGKYSFLFESIEDSKAVETELKDLVLNLEKGDKTTADLNINKLKELGVDFQDKEKEIIEYMQGRIEEIHTSEGKNIAQLLEERKEKMASAGIQQLRYELPPEDNIGLLKKEGVDLTDKNISSDEYKKLLELAGDQNTEVGKVANEALKSLGEHQGKLLEKEEITKILDKYPELKNIQDVESKIRKIYIAEIANNKNFVPDDITKEISAAFNNSGDKTGAFYGEFDGLALQKINAGFDLTAEVKGTAKQPSEMTAEEYLKQKGDGGGSGGGAEDVKADTGKTSAVVEKMDYQGGKHVWGEVEKQLGARSGFKEHFTGLSPEEKTHAIDYFKDRVVADPEKYGIPKGVDVDHLTKAQLKAVKWDEVFKDAETDKWGPNLSEEAKANIRKNNELLKEWASKTGKTIESEEVDKLLKELNKAGSVEDYIAASATESAGEFAGIEDVKTAVDKAGSFNEIFENMNALNMDPKSTLEINRLNSIISERLHELGYNEDLKINGRSWNDVGDTQSFSGSLDNIDVKFELDDKITPDSFARLHESAKELRSLIKENPQFKLDTSIMRVDTSDNSIELVRFDLPGGHDQDVLLSFTKGEKGFEIDSYDKVISSGEIPPKVESLLKNLPGKVFESDGTKTILKEIGDEVGKLETRAKVVGVYEQRFNNLTDDMDADDLYEQRVRVVKDMQSYIDKHPEASYYVEEKSLAAWMVENKDAGDDKYKHVWERLQGIEADEEIPPPVVEEDAKLTPERKANIEEKINEINKEIEEQTTGVEVNENQPDYLKHTNSIVTEMQAGKITNNEQFIDSISEDLGRDLTEDEVARANKVFEENNEKITTVHENAEKKTMIMQTKGKNEVLKMMKDFSESETLVAETDDLQKTLEQAYESAKANIEIRQSSVDGFVGVGDDKKAALWENIEADAKVLGYENIDELITDVNKIKGIKAPEFTADAMPSDSTGVKKIVAETGLELAKHDELINKELPGKGTQVLDLLKRAKESGWY